MRRFYKDKRWIRKREAILRRDGYMCRMSARYGKKVPATTVHHIFPLTEYPQYKLEGWNLISVCADAHNRLHDRVTGELTEEGRDLMIRTARQRGIEICQSGTEDGLTEEACSDAGSMEKRIS